MAWLRSRKILSLYVRSSPRSAHAYVSGRGWLRLRPDSPDGVSNMLTAATHAKADGRYVDVYEDPASHFRVIAVY